MKTTKERQHALSLGRTLALTLDTDTVDQIQIRSASGDVELAIEIGPDGPRLKVRAVDIEIVAEKRLTMRCDELDIQVQRTAKVAAGGPVTLAGEDVYVNAERGEIALRANDDVDVRGERIRLNCDDPPMPASWEELERRLSSPKSVGD